MEKPIDSRKIKALKAKWIKIHRKCHDGIQPCLLSGCEEPSIFSHILQKNKILNKLASNGKVLALKPNIFNENPLEFIHIGLNDIFSFRGFCKNHDFNLFKQIESETIDFFNYNNQLLFTYRTIVNERRKKEAALCAIRKAVQDEEFFISVDIPKISLLYQQFSLGLNDLLYYENTILNDIYSNDSKQFVFDVFELPRFELCCSAIFTLESLEDRRPFLNLGFDLPYPLTPVVLQFIPYNDITIVVLGYFTKHSKLSKIFVESFANANTDTKLKKISNLLLQKIENWCFSEKFYHTYIAHRKKAILNIVNPAFFYSAEIRELEINLFNP